MAFGLKLLSFLPTIFSGVKEYVFKKKEIQKLETTAAIEIKKAQINAQIERAKSHDAADTVLDKSSLEQTGWKDEYLLILTTLPMIFIMLSPFIDVYMALKYAEEFEYHVGLLRRAVFEGFSALDKAPDYYWYMVAAVYIHSLGMRRMLRIVLEKGFNPFKK